MGVREQNGGVAGTASILATEVVIAVPRTAGRSASRSVRSSGPGESQVTAHVTARVVGCGCRGLMRPISIIPFQRTHVAPLDHPGRFV